MKIELYVSDLVSRMDYLIDQRSRTNWDYQYITKHFDRADLVASVYEYLLESIEHDTFGHRYLRFPIYDNEMEKVCHVYGKIVSLKDRRIELNLFKYKTEEFDYEDYPWPNKEIDQEMHKRFHDIVCDVDIKVRKDEFGNPTSGKVEMKLYYKLNCTLHPTPEVNRLNCLAFA